VNTQPSRDDFVALARDYTVVPVWREVLADLETPVSAFVKLVGDGEGFLLESVEHAQRWGRFSFIGRDPALTMVVRGDHVELVGDAPAGVPTIGALGGPRSVVGRLSGADPSELPPFHGGVVGYLGYDVVREVERLPNVPPDDLGMPDACSRSRATSRRSIIFGSGCISSRTCFWPRTRRARRQRCLRPGVGAPRYACRRARAPVAVRSVVPPPDQLDELPPFRSTMPSDTYRAAVEAAREHILAGDIFQVVLAQRFDLDGDFDPFDVYRVLRQVNPSRTCTSCATRRSRSGFVAGAHGASTRPAGDLEADRGHSPPRRNEEDDRRWPRS